MKAFFVHETAVIDDGCEIGSGTKIWHFSHIMPNCKIGENCNIGQNVVVSSDVILGKNVKVLNYVYFDTSITCEDYLFLVSTTFFTEVFKSISVINFYSEYDNFRI